ncbi:hypothetical protein ACLUEY_08420 [Vreelandella aquamarina]
MHSYVKDQSAQQRKAATIKVARTSYLAAKKQGKVNVTLSAEEAQKRAQKSVFRFS